MGDILGTPVLWHFTSVTGTGVSYSRGEEGNGKAVRVHLLREASSAGVAEFSDQDCSA